MTHLEHFYAGFEQCFSRLDYGEAPRIEYSRVEQRVEPGEFQPSF